MDLKWIPMITDNELSNARARLRWETARSLSYNTSKGQ